MHTISSSYPIILSRSAAMPVGTAARSAAGQKSQQVVCLCAAVPRYSTINI